MRFKVDQGLQIAYLAEREAALDRLVAVAELEAAELAVR